ncbi:hypothetical protein H8E06_00590 [bacterium]|nr:hypothetical protein [bacterium]
MSFKFTGEHLFVDNNSTNTVEFFAAANSHVELVKKYANDLAIQNIWKYASHTHDPITKQAEFFNLLSQSLHNLQNNEEGSIDAKVNNLLAQKLEVDLSDDESFVLTNTGELETRVNTDTNLTEALVVSNASVKEGEKPKKRYVPVEENVVDDIAKIKNLLIDGYGAIGMPEEVVLYWIERYRTSHSKVKEEFKKIIPELSKSIFQNYSDTVGYMTRIEESLDRFTIPLNDIKLERHDDIICNVYNPIIEDKIDIQTKNLIYEMTKHTETQFRQNIQNIVVAHGASTVAHGENLVGDYRHWHRLRDVVTDFTSTIERDLGYLYTIIEFANISEDDNSQVVLKNANKLQVEKSEVDIDLLQNKIQKLQKNITNAQVLSAG